MRQFQHASHAIQRGDLQTVKNALADEAFDLNVQDKYYKTPLMHACLKGDITISKYLIENG